VTILQLWLAVRRIRASADGGAQVREHLPCQTERAIDALDVEDMLADRYCIAGAICGSYKSEGDAVFPKAGYLSTHSCHCMT
jgi:hypothetical protein